MLSLKINDKEVIARFSPAGIPEQVRRNLRQLIPGALRALAAEVNKNLDSGLKSRQRVQIKKGEGEMVENAQGIFGRLEVIWTGDPDKSFIPQILETGAKPHVIEPRNAKALAFEFMGALAFFKRVNHPGFPGIHYLENAFESRKTDIQAGIERAVTGL